MDEKGVTAFKRKKDSSMVRAIDMVKEGTAQAAVSCGNTSALTACSTLMLRRMPGVERPALASVWPSREQHFVILDVGANPRPNPRTSSTTPYWATTSAA
jgi:glycerol-3-phosphate acyltransferase PlsX